MRGGRRQLLRSVAGAIGLGGVTSRVRATGPRPVPAGDRTRGGSDASAEEGETSADRPSRATARQPEANDALASRTAAVLDEIDWFAREYPAAIQTYRAAMRRGARAAARLRGAGGVTPAEARQLQSTFDDVVRTVREAFDPQFLLHRSIRRRTETHTATVLRFARRNDTDRVNEELQRLETYAASYASDVFVREQLPRVPILNRLIERLRAGELRESRPLLFRVYHGSTGFRSYAYERRAFGRYDLLAPGYNSEFVERFDREFLAVDAPANRLDRYYLAVFEGQDGSRQPFDSRAPTPEGDQIIYAQRYPDAATAAGAFTRILDRDGVRRDEFRRDRYSLGDSEWDRVYYPFEGDVLYTLVGRAGRFLLAIGPGRTAWEERVGWGRLLRRTFLAGE